MDSAIFNTLIQQHLSSIVDTGTPEQQVGALRNFAERIKQDAILHACEQFERALNASVSVMMRPHIAGVASVVRHQVLQPEPAGKLDAAAAAFLAKQPHQRVVRVSCLVQEASYQVSAEEVSEINCSNAVYPVNAQAFSRIEHDQENSIISLTVFGAVEDREQIMAGVKFAIADYASLRSDEYRQRANALDTVAARLEN